MKKEEILEKSIRENLWEDERSKQVTIKSESNAAQIGNIILIVVIFWKMIHKMPYSDLFGILWIQIAITFLYKYKNKTEGKLYLFLGIALLCVSSIFLLDFFINGAN